MSKFSIIYDSIKAGKTILGVGPMSRNCINAAIKIANTRKIPIILIGSRRQIEARSLGGGYVDTTERFCRYVKKTDKENGKYVFLARDHGGPWQGGDEYDLSHEEAMNTARESYRVDIESGMDILHIDPSLKTRPASAIMRDIDDLMSFCLKESYNMIADRTDPIFEIGTEEHGDFTSDPTQFSDFARRYRLNSSFIVGNTGLWVKETRNVGRFDIEKTKELVKVCNEHNLFLKGHNSDYISDDTIQSINQAGVHSINVAPEFGITETVELFNTLENLGFHQYIEELFYIFYNSNKWKKWIMNDPISYNRSMLAIIAGHYNFNNPRVLEIKKDVRKRTGVSIDTICQWQVKRRIERYLDNLGWTE